jgi:hypothetical protein
VVRHTPRGEVRGKKKKKCSKPNSLARVGGGAGNVRKTWAERSHRSNAHFWRRLAGYVQINTFLGG